MGNKYVKENPLQAFYNLCKYEQKGYFLNGSPSACLIFQGKARTSDKKYAKFRGVNAHRWIYKQTVNPNITFYETIDHKCREKLCMNVQHFEVVTHGENSRRANFGKAKVHYCAEGHTLRRKEALCLQCSPQAYLVDPDLTYYEKRAKICSEAGISPVQCAHGHEVFPTNERRCIKCSNAATMANYHGPETFYQKRLRIGGMPVLCVKGHDVPDTDGKQCLICMRIKADKWRVAQGQRVNVYNNKPRE